MSSFEIAQSGLDAVNQQLDSTSNNIANAGTIGYKSQSTQFSAMYAGSQAMGVSVAGTAQSISKGGSMISTGNALDLAINNSGFFIMEDANGNISYTRNGSFTTDQNGYIVNSSGDKLQGYPVDADGNLEEGTVSDLQIKTGNIPAQATDSVTFTANLDSDSEAIDTASVPFDPTNDDSYNSSYTTSVYDSQGNEHTVTQYFVKTGDNQWTVHYTFDGTDTGQTQDLTFNKDGSLASPTTPVSLQFTPNGGTDPIDLTIDYGDCSQYSGTGFNVTANNADGYPSAQQNGVQVDSDGKVYATYSNGQRMLQGQIALANFPDEDALQAVSGTSWVETGASGAPLIGTPGSGSFGTLSAGYLEGSNVDLTQELVDLMTEQRFYQANTKVISTSSTLDQALFQAM